VKKMRPADMRPAQPSKVNHTLARLQRVLGHHFGRSVEDGVVAHVVMLGPCATVECQHQPASPHSGISPAGTGRDSAGAREAAAMAARIASKTGSLMSTQ
jgi:hypothetical protein